MKRSGIRGTKIQKPGLTTFHRATKTTMKHRIDPNIVDAATERQRNRTAGR